MEKLKVNIGKKLGEGSEKVVYEDPDNKDRVKGVYYRKKRSERMVKGRFYIAKILHLLCPDQVRDVHATYSDPDVIISQRVESSTVRKIEGTFKYPPDNEIKKFVAKLEKDYGVTCDHAWINFMYDKKDNLVYVDTLEPW